MNLAWGATWLTSSVVFGLILLMLLISSILAYRFKIPYGASMLGVLLSLVLAYFVPTADLVRSSLVLRLALSLLVLGLPVFVFRKSIRSTVTAGTGLRLESFGCCNGRPVRIFFHGFRTESPAGSRLPDLFLRLRCAPPSLSTCEAGGLLRA